MLLCPIESINNNNQVLELVVGESHLAVSDRVAKQQSISEFTVIVTAIANEDIYQSRREYYTLIHGCTFLVRLMQVFTRCKMHLFLYPLTYNRHRVLFTPCKD